MARGSRWPHRLGRLAGGPKMAREGPNFFGRKGGSRKNPQKSVDSEGVVVRPGDARGGPRARGHAHGHAYEGAYFTSGDFASDYY